MVVEVKFKNHEFKKYTKAVCVGILGCHKDKLYIQTRNRGCAVETFIPLTDIDCYNVREPY